MGRANAERWGEPAVGVLQVYALLSDGSAAVFALRDQVRPESAAVIEALHNAGIRPIVMITGDSQAPATVVAAEVGVDEVKSRLMPEEKVAVVRALRERHGSVAMFGDGVNDAPTLAEATVGLAMGAAGSPVAIETADVALMGNDLTKLPYAIRLSRKASRTIRFNIAVANGLKVVLGVGAVAGMVFPRDRSPGRRYGWLARCNS